MIGNINADKSYTNFLENYLGAIASLGYCKRMEYWMFTFEGPVEQQVDFVLGILDDLEDWKLFQKQEDKYNEILFDLSTEEYFKYDKHLFF